MNTPHVATLNNTYTVRWNPALQNSILPTYYTVTWGGKHGTIPDDRLTIKRRVVSDARSERLMAEATLNFPNSFRWGTATSSHQVEGNNRNNDWWAWEGEPGRILNGHTTGRAFRPNSDPRAGRIDRPLVTRFAPELLDEMFPA
jgi:hypothetical protein